MSAAANKGQLTPMMRQYQDIAKTLPQNTILFFRLGDFYEMFFDDAIKASEILNITLTGREGGAAGRIPMCGIPYHAFQGYVRTLIENNLKVAIAEQVGDPKATKGLVERKVTRIITPATYLEDEARGKNPDYLAAVFTMEDQTALAYLDWGTGEFFVREFESERLLSELSLLSPREVVLSQSQVEKSKLDATIRESLSVSVSVYEDWVFDAEDALNLLTEVFNLASPQAILFHDQKRLIGACGAILYYLRDHRHAALGHMKLPVLLDASKYMVLDRQTQKSLELVVNQSGRKDMGTLLSTIDQSLTSMGARVLYHWVTQPLLKKAQVEMRQNCVAEMVEQIETTQSLRQLFKGVKDMERTLSRLNHGVANARDLVNLRVFLERVPEIQKCMKSFKAPMLAELNKQLQPFPKLRDLISKAIMDQPPLAIKEGGLIRDGYHAELDELREISTNGKTWILDFEKREASRTGIRSLKVKYSQVFGYTIDISKPNLHLVPSDYHRKQTLANSERFIVPELKAWDEKISGAQDKIKALEYQLFLECRETILKELTPLQKMAKAIGVLDALASLAMTALSQQWIRPEVLDAGVLEIEGGRHPVVEAILPSGEFVDNDAQLDDKSHQLIVLTGPNMAGKSTYIRQVGLIVLLAQMGSFVPAQRARIGIVDRIFTRIGASDDLARGESTFMVEMLETAHILHKATERSLIILDEVGRGTSTFDGVSIAWAICEYLAQGKNRPRTLFATHYHELTQLQDHFESVKNYNITVKETRKGIVFLRKVVQGGSDRSYGIHVAKLAGLPKEVTDRAEKILAILESENLQATQIIEGKEKKAKVKVQDLGPTLFDFAQSPHPAIEELEALDIDDLTPKQALDKLFELQQKVKAHV